MNKHGLHIMMTVVTAVVLALSAPLGMGRAAATTPPPTPTDTHAAESANERTATKSATSVSSYIQRHIANPAQVGSGLYSFLFMDIYNARLIAPNGEYDADKPFALSLTYLRSFKGSAIAKESIKQMRGQGFDDAIKSAAWYNLMNDIFPDVQGGDTITGIAVAKGETAGKQTVFFLNGEEIGTINDPEFTDRFFGIWLSSDTSAPQLRSELLATQ